MAAVSLFAVSCISIDLYPPAVGGIDCTPQADKKLDPRCPKPEVPPPPPPADPPNTSPDCDGTWRHIEQDCTITLKAGCRD